jgi:hypothetical protein
LYGAGRFVFARGRDFADAGEARPVVLLLQPGDTNSLSLDHEHK